MRSPQTNGFVERFNRTVLSEFFKIAFRGNFYETVESLQVDLDEWLVHYNTERPHQGYRNRGKRPRDTVMGLLGMRVSCAYIVSVNEFVFADIPKSPSL